MIEVRDCQLVGHVQRRDSRYTGKNDDEYGVA